MPKQVLPVQKMSRLGFFFGDDLLLLCLCFVFVSLSCSLEWMWATLLWSKTGLLFWEFWICCLEILCPSKIMINHKVLLNFFCYLSAKKWTQKRKGKLTHALLTTHKQQAKKTKRQQQFCQNKTWAQTKSSSFFCFLFLSPHKLSLHLKKLKLGRFFFFDCEVFCFEFSKRPTRSKAGDFLIVFGHSFHFICQ